MTRYGWHRDLPDHRDRRYESVGAPLPPKVDLRPQCPPIYDQGQLGSCTANAICGAIEFNEIKSKARDPWVPSRLFLYYQEREMEGTTQVDGGAAIRDGIKVAVSQGVCPEALWPYDVREFDQKPPGACYDAAVRDRISSYRSVPQSLYAMKDCLVQGFPFVFGFTVYESMQTTDVARTGIIPLPQPDEGAVGGHAICAVGYDDSKGAMIIRNSWGTVWGVGGYGYLPYVYITDAGLAADFWTLRSAPGGRPLTLADVGPWTAER